ncbi:hypothetical protein QBC32DRAFT_327441 [Pseudoneurospora amorphoporcata]|uniref:Uncharacterized protein n=1 Tax=Pseudoneurospora amorphoporcata TaxID=241081 RepID=A0AAN6NNG3_9PEZI|nr:hypothetical protein QBC32DRAFT_327441 [Pseudoneurospora amorphoporcata]
MTNLKSTEEPPPYYPPSIARDISTQFLDENSYFRRELAELSRTLGHEVIFEADWQRLVNQYGEQHNPTIVVALVAILIVWNEVLRSILGRAEMDGWVGELLDRVVEAGGKLRVVLDVWEYVKFGTSWSQERNGFLVHLPKHFLFVKRAFLKARGVAEEFKTVEPGKGAETATELEWELGLWQLRVRDENTSEERSSAAAVVTGTTTASSKTATTTTTTSPSTDRTPTPFPTVDSLPSLVELCSRPPYHLTITQETHGWICISGSHGPSIKLIDQYISRWTPDVVMNSEDTPPTDVPVALDGILYDVMSTLTIQQSVQVPGSTRPLSMVVPMVLAIVQGTLGYEIVWQGSGEYRLRRDVPFV